MKRILSLALTGLAVAGTLVLGAPAASAAAPPARPAATAVTTAVPAGTATGTAAAAPAGTAAALAPPASLASLASPTPSGPSGPKGTTGPGKDSVTIDLNGVGGKPSQSIVLMLGLTVLSVAPAILLLCTSFTKIFVVLSITRNALGLSNVPPNQVLAGLAIFISLFIMGPVASDVNDKAIQPYLKGEKSVSQAVEAGTPAVREFLTEHTRKDDLALFTKIADQPKPANAAAVPMTTLIPAFVLSELRAAFIIGFVIYVPFLIIDLVISAALMSMGMMMLPPVTVAMPFKLLLFVLVNGWGLIVTSLVGSYQ
ncbi:flagellar type III secretion system pore protein FliP [Planomonospora sp. ID82291]|uniref:flagellar type III secretion system pore protein FliP n=1 Tax=Planomonospora sp. ID82291 TaxID=2738136 RepID=UPI0018C3B971|nr:flagellar type III secretion system pore protein FliP [Planomonospora sp. ID82291]MBG0818495.1 flagellar type III secretion system pore protein FliP [Planomonospora sp. ID82291]